MLNFYLYKVTLEDYYVKLMDCFFIDGFDNNNIEIYLLEKQIYHKS